MALACASPMISGWAWGPVRALTQDSPLLVRKFPSAWRRQARFCLGLGRGQWLLLEQPSAPVGCLWVHRDPLLLGSLVRAGVFTSVTAGSLDGRFGGRVRRFALELLREGLVHNVGSDAHDHIQRPPGIRPPLERAGFGDMVNWFACDVPAAIIGREDIPRGRPAARGQASGPARVARAASSTRPRRARTPAESSVRGGATSRSIATPPATRPRSRWPTPP